MIFVVILKIISVLLAIVGTTFLIPIITAISFKEFSYIVYFLLPMIFSWILCFSVYISTKKIKIHLTTKLTFAVVALAWIVTSVFASIPFFSSGVIPDFTDAFFESVSGFTTTGASIVNDIESLPKCMNMLRALTHWLGGMGIVALTVALLPILGVGGFQLIKAETTGPEKGKVTPKITTTAKALWIIYFVLTVLETILLMIFGMNFYEALCHSFSTLGTGGFSTRNESIKAFNSPGIDIVIMIFMFLAGINFSLYYHIFKGKFREVRENSELKAYFFIVLIFTLLIALCILPDYKNFAESLRYSAFNVLTIISTTGFANTDYTKWSTTAQFLLFILFFIGGCSGSTAGGIKVIRLVILGKKIKTDMKKMIHPRGVFTIRINKHPANQDLHSSVSTFIAVYFILVILTSLAGCFFGLDIFTSLTGAMSMTGNVGPAFGKLGPVFNYSWIPSALKWIYSFSMLAGRLELFTILIFLSSDYWKK